MSYLKKSDNVIKKLITIQKLEPRPVGFKPNNLQLGMHMSACGQDTRIRVQVPVITSIDIWHFTTDNEMSINILKCKV